MYPFKNSRVKYMRKVTLMDNQEFVGEDMKNIVVGESWVRVELGDEESILYPLHRVRDLCNWTEVE